MRTLVCGLEDSRTKSSALCLQGSFLGWPRANSLFQLKKRQVTENKICPWTFLSSLLCLFLNVFQPSWFSDSDVPTNLPFCVNRESCRICLWGLPPQPPHPVLLLKPIHLHLQHFQRAIGWVFYQFFLPDLQSHSPAQMNGLEKPEPFSTGVRASTVPAVPAIPQWALAAPFSSQPLLPKKSHLSPNFPLQLDFQQILYPAS